MDRSAIGSEQEIVLRDRVHVAEQDLDRVRGAAVGRDVDQRVVAGLRDREIAKCNAERRHVDGFVGYGQASRFEPIARDLVVAPARLEDERVEATLSDEQVVACSAEQDIAAKPAEQAIVAAANGGML